MATLLSVKRERVKRMIHWRKVCRAVRKQLPPTHGVYYNEETEGLVVYSLLPHFLIMERMKQKALEELHASSFRP